MTRSRIMKVELKAYTYSHLLASHSLSRYCVFKSQLEVVKFQCAQFDVRLDKKNVINLKDLFQTIDLVFCE